LAAGFCPKYLAFAGKIMVLPESGGAAPQPLWVIRLWLLHKFNISATLNNEIDRLID